MLGTQDELERLVLLNGIRTFNRLNDSKCPEGVMGNSKREAYSSLYTTPYQQLPHWMDGGDDRIMTRIELCVWVCALKKVNPFKGMHVMLVPDTDF